MEKNPPNQMPESQALGEKSSEQRSFAEAIRTLANSGMSVVLAESYSRGPLPSPEALEKYQQVSPEALSLILREYDEEGTHRRNSERLIISDRVLMARLGLLAAFLITILFLAAGFYLILHGHDVAGASICGAGLVSVVIAFLRHTSSSSSSNGKK